MIARHGRRRAARRAGGDRVRRPQPVQVDGPEPDRVRAELRAAAQGGQGPWPAVPRRAVPDAGLDAGRQLPQQHRLRARACGSRCTRSRAQRRRRPVPHPLRPVARDPHGPRHPLDLPVPQGRRLRLPDRRHAREGPGDPLRGRRRLGLRRPDGAARRLGRRRAVVEPSRSGQRVEEADGAVRARASRHGPPRSARLPAEPHRRLARPPARRARAARLRPGDDAADRRARVRRRRACRTRRCCSRSWRLDGVHPAHRPGGGIDVRVAGTRCWPPQGIPGAGRRPPGIPGADDEGRLRRRHARHEGRRAGLRRGDGAQPRGRRGARRRRHHRPRPAARVRRVPTSVRPRSPHPPGRRRGGVSPTTAAPLSAAMAVALRGVRPRPATTSTRHRRHRRRRAARRSITPAMRALPVGVPEADGLDARLRQRRALRRRLPTSR